MNTDADSSIIHVSIHNDGDVALNKQPSSSSSTASSRSMLKWGAIIFALIALVGISTVVGITMSNKSTNIALKSISPAAVSVAAMDVQDTCSPHPNHTGCANNLYRLNENGVSEKCDTKIGCPSTQFCQITDQTTNIINGVITTHIGQCVAGGGSGGDGSGGDGSGGDGSGSGGDGSGSGGGDGSGGDGDSTAQCSQHPNHTGCDNFLYREIGAGLLEKCDTKIGGCSSSQFCNTGITDIKMLNGVVTSSELGRCDHKPIDDKPIDDKPIDDKPIDDKPIDDRSGSNSASTATVIMSVFMVFVAVCIM